MCAGHSEGTGAIFLSPWTITPGIKGGIQETGGFSLHEPLLTD